MSTITPEILLQAYRVGVFPMAESAGDPALYWVEPEDRGIIPLDHFHVSTSLRKSVRSGGFDVRIDTAFDQVMHSCAAQTSARKETWINNRILKLYNQLHHQGYCHSVECWRGGELLGGLYGLHIGGAFFGESMFARATDASKVALVHLVARLKFGGFTLLDTQFVNDHLLQFGCVSVAKAQYRTLLKSALTRKASFAAFSDDHNAQQVLALLTD